MKVKGDIDVEGKVIGDFLDLNIGLPVPPYADGRMFYDKVHNCMTSYDDILGSALQIGQELRVRVYNGNGVTIPDGAAVTVTGRRPLPSMALEVELAICSDKVSALNTIGITTTEIPVGEEGWATTAGIIRDIDTSAYLEGAAIWLSSTVPGAYQTFRPASPDYEVRMGGVAKSHATLGELYAEIRIISNNHDNARLINGCILEDHTVTITKTATTTTLNINELGSKGFISIIVDQEYIKVPVPASIVLTNGTDAIPTPNYIYINNVGVLTKSLTTFPTAQQFAPIATIILQSAASANTYGPYKVHAWTDHLADSTGQGHISHLNKWIRSRPALWKSGIILSTTVGAALPTIPIAYTSGIVSQLHLHTFPATNTATGTGLYSINNPVTPYARRTSLSPSINTDSLGVAIGNNKYYTLIIWGVISEQTGDCKLFFNLPSGSYTNVTDALNDLDKFNNYSIPDEYVGTGFLLTQITLQRTTTTVEIIPNSVKDLKGLFPATGGGGGTTGGGGVTAWTQLSDTPTIIVANKLVLGSSGGGELVQSDAVAPISKALVTNQVLNSYNTLTGVFTSIQPTFASLASKPTTIAGYGITNAMTTAHPANSLVAQNIIDIGNLSGTNTGDQVLTGLDYAPTSHTHPISQVTGLQAALDNATVTVADVPAESPPTATEGRLWYNPKTGLLSIAVDAVWVSIGSVPEA